MNNASSTLLFAGPDPKSFRSGGNLYNAALLDAIQQIGWTWQILPSLEDAAKHESFPILVDSLYLDQLTHLTPKQKARSLLLVHHLPGMEASEQYSDIHRKKESELLTGLGGIVANSDFTHEYIVRLGIHDIPILILPPCLVLDKRERSFAFDYPLRLLLSANIIPRKGLLHLLENLSLFRPPADKIQLVVAGNADLNPVYTMRCRSQVQSDPYLEKIVDWKGDLAPNEINELLAQSDILISPASMESFGMAVMEAIAVGVPVLALERGNIPYLVGDDNHGKLFSSPEKIVRFIRKKVETKPKKFLRWLKEISARRISPQRSWENHAHLLINFINQNQSNAK